MKKVLIMGLMMAASALTVSAQDMAGKKPASPPAKVSQTIGGGTTITIDYAQPSLKGRTMGKDVEPMDGKVWRAGANAATFFEVSKDVMVEGKALPKGKYSFFTLKNGNTWTLIFNKTTMQEGKPLWGTEYDSVKADDALKVDVKGGKGPKTEKLTYTISKAGKVSLMWGTTAVSFTVK